MSLHEPLLPAPSAHGLASAAQRHARRGGDNNHSGRQAEDAAHAAYAARGGEVLARRYRTPEGEIDLVVRLGDVLCFVEVKRRRRSVPDSPVTSRGWARIAGAAARWLAEAHDAGHPVSACRFDAVLVDAVGRPTVIEDAWRPDFA